MSLATLRSLARELGRKPPDGDHLALGVRVVERLPHVQQVHHVDVDGTIWTSTGRTILRRDAGATDFATVATFPRVYPRDAVSAHRITQRAARADKCNVRPTGEGALVAIRASVIYHASKGSLTQLGELRGDCALHGGLALGRDGSVYVGEYAMNPERDSVRIYRVTPDASRVELAHEYPAKSIRHVHGVYEDPYARGTLWVASGDLDGECYLWRTDDEFRTVERLGDGSQRWRAVRLFFTRDAVVWLTDTETDANYAMRLVRATGALEVGCPVPASTWYGIQCSDGPMIGFTVVEDGPGVRRSSAAALASTDGKRWRELFSLPKDRWRPYWLFKNGVLSSPTGAMSSRAVWLSAEGLAGVDGSSLCLDVGAALETP